jgi:hypothetical protein
MLIVFMLCVLMQSVLILFVIMMIVLAIYQHCFFLRNRGHHDTRHNYIQHNDFSIAIRKCDTHHNDAQYNGILRLKIIMLRVNIRCNMLSVIMLNVVAPKSNIGHINTLAVGGATGSSVVKRE